MNFIFISVLDISWAKNEDFVRSLFLSWFISNLEIEKWHCSNWTLFNTFSYWTEFDCLYLVGLLKALWLSMNVKCATTNFCYIALVLLFHGGDYLLHFYMPPPPPTRKKRAKKKKKNFLFLFHSWMRDILGSSWSERLKVCFPDSFTFFAYITEYALSEYVKSMSHYP